MSTPVWDDGAVLVCVIAGFCDRCPRPPKPTLCVQLIGHGNYSEPIQLCRSCFCTLAWEVGLAVGIIDRQRDGN